MIAVKLFLVINLVISVLDLILKYFRKIFNFLLIQNKKINKN